MSCFNPSMLPWIVRKLKVVSALITISTVVVKLQFVWLLYQWYLLLKPFCKPWLVLGKLKNVVFLKGFHLFTTSITINEYLYKLQSNRKWHIFIKITAYPYWNMEQRHRCGPSRCSILTAAEMRFLSSVYKESQDRMRRTLVWDDLKVKVLEY